jgi:hypothetical protein
MVRKDVKTMAVVATPLNSILVIGYQTGLTPDGSPILRQKSLSDVRSDAAEQAVYDAAQALFGLAQYPVINVIYRKNFELSDQ